MHQPVAVRLAVRHGVVDSCAWDERPVGIASRRRLVGVLDMLRGVPGEHLDVRLLRVVQVREDAGDGSGGAAHAAVDPDRRERGIEFLERDLARLLGFVVDACGGEGEVAGVVRRAVGVLS